MNTDISKTENTDPIIEYLHQKVNNDHFPNCRIELVPNAVLVHLGNFPASYEKGVMLPLITLENNTWDLERATDLLQARKLIVVVGEPTLPTTYEPARPMVFDVHAFIDVVPEGMKVATVNIKTAYAYL